MSGREPITLSGRVLNEESTVGLGELCRAACVSADLLLDMVQEGLLEPLGGRSPVDWRFPETALPRVWVAVRLQRDLQVNLAGAALALDLLEELNTLRRRVRALEHQLPSDPD
jgi:chaperone modulatory protein CbpM